MSDEINYIETVEELIEAIEAANAAGSGVIELEPDTTFIVDNSNTNSASFAFPEISVPLQIKGNGATIERDGSASQFAFFEAQYTGLIATLRIEDLILRNAGGSTGRYAAVDINASEDDGASLELINCTFDGNETQYIGGALYTSVPTLIDTCVFKNNKCGGAGAAIYSYHYNGKLQIINSTFDGNDCVYGGAIYVEGYDDETIIANCQFEDNVAQSSTACLYFDGQANTKVEITSTSFVNNQALDNHPSSNKGEIGVLYAEVGEVHIFHCVFDGNTAINSHPTIDSWDDGIFVAHNNTFINNQVTSDTSAPIVFDSGVQFYDNAPDMRYNYWGTDDGPSGAGAGSGQPVPDGLWYSPFLSVNGEPIHDGSDTCFSTGNDAATAGNPISLRTGEKREQATDLSLNTKMGALSFTRGYRQSTQADRDFMGRGWSHNHHITLTEDTGLKKITIEQASGTTILYDDNADDIFEGAAGSSAVIVKDTSDYTLTTPDGSQYVFNSSGDLLSHTMRDGQTWYYHYDSNNDLILVHDDASFNGSDESNIQWALRFAYYDTSDFKDGKLWRVGILESTNLATTPDGPYVEFDYTELSGVGVFLTRVRDVLDYSQCYRYGFQEGETDTLLKTYLYRRLAIMTAGVTDCTSTDVIELSDTSYTINGSNEITQIVQERGDGLISETFDFGSDTTTQEVTGFSSYATTHNYSNGVYQGTEDPDGNATKELLTNQYNKAIQTDRNGNSTLMKWSADGERLEGMVDPLGNEMKMLYDPHSRIVCSQDASGRTTLAKYEGTSREAVAQWVTDGRNLIANGLMDQAANWADVGTPTVSEQRPPSAMPFGRYVNAPNASEGIESIAWDVVANNTYTLRARVNVLSGTVKLQVPGVTGLAVSSNGTGWQTLEVDDTPTSAASDVHAQLIADGVAADFYVSYVTVREDDGSSVTTLPLQGNLMPDAYWTDISGAEPDTNESVNRQRYLGNAAWYVDADAVDEGMASTSFDLVDGETYQIFAYVRPVSGTVAMELEGASSTLASDNSGNGTDDWERLEITYTASADEAATLRFLASNSAASEFFVDAVFVLDKTIILRQSEKTYNSRRQVTNKKQLDPADGTSVLRETEYCYDDDTCYTGSDPERGLLWRTIIKEQGGGNDIHITNTYDDFGRLIQRQQNSQFGDCNTSRTVYDDKGQVVASICNYHPDTYAAPETATEAAALYALVGDPDKNQVTTYAYDALGRQIEVTTDAGTSFERVTHFVYDSLGRVTRRIENYVNPDNMGSPTYTDPDTWDWDGSQWVDGAGTPVPIEHGADLDENIITDTAYNSFGQVRLQRDVLGHAMLYGYNTLGQLVKTIVNPVDDDYNNDYVGTTPDPALASYVINDTVSDADIVTTMRYDAVGNEIERSDALDRKSFTIYDAMNRPVKVILSAKADATIDLDVGDTGYLASNDPRSTGYVLSQDPDRDQVLMTSYDSLGRVVRRQRVLENRDNGIQWDTTLYGYDTLGRQVRAIQHASDPDYLDLNDDPSLASYTVEVDATDVDVITETDYDVQGRVQLTHDLDEVFNNEMWQGYDGFNRVVQQVANASEVGALDPDDPNYVGNLNDAASDLISKTDFNASGRVVKQRRVLRTNDAGTALEWVYTLYGYDSRGRVIKTIQNASNPNMSNLAEDLSNYSPIGSNSDEDRITETVYDAQGRVKKTVDTRGNTMLYGYDRANRRVTTIVNASNASYDYESNSDTTLASYTGSSPDEDQDRITTTEYDLAGRVIASTDVAGWVAVNVYDELGRSLLRVTNYDNPDNGGNPTYTEPDTWVWDGTQAKWIDGASTPVAIAHGSASDMNLISAMVYNKGGELVSTRDVHGTVTAFAYDGMGRRVQVTQAQGTNLETTDYTCFDKAGRVRRQLMNINTDADLDARADDAWVFVPAGHGGNNDTNIVLETIYDRASRPVERINPEGDVIETIYFKSGQVDTVTHKDVMVEGTLQDVAMLYRYDALYRRTLVVQNYVAQGTSKPEDWVFESGVWKDGAGGTAIDHDPTSSGNAAQNIIVQASYDKSGRMVSLRDPNGNVNEYDYDQLGRRTKLSNPLGYEWLTAYEDVGNNSRVTMTYPGIDEVSSVWQAYDVQQDFDRLGRLSEVSYPDADVTPDLAFSYDVSGNRTAMTETDSLAAKVRETSYSYDAMNRLIEAELDRDGDGTAEEAVQYSYDERGLRTNLVIDPNGDNLQVTYVYDEKGRLVSLTDWDSQETAYVYDRLNRHSRTLHPNGVQSRYDYDAAGRLTHLRHRDGHDTLAAFKYQVDARGNRVKTWETLAGETRTIVAGDDEVTERGTWVTNGSLRETTQWDAKMTLSVWGKQDVKLTIGTGPDNSIFDIYIDGTLYISPDGYAASAGEREIDLVIRDEQLREHVIELRNRHEKNLASSGYELHFKQLTLGKVQEIDYSYDALARVLSADYADGSRSYDYLYDLAGNRLQESVTIGMTTTVTDWTYDAANRVNTMQVGSNPIDTFSYDANGNLLSAGGHSYEWNHAGRMTQLDTGSGIYHYEYDGDNNRLSQRLGTTVTEYLLDTQPGLAEVLRESDGTTTSHYVHGVRGVQALEQSNTWTLLLQDGLGSVRAQVDDIAQVDASQHHSPYGQPFGQSGTWEGSFGYAGEQIDPTGLSYNRARYYDPNMGMFTALDPFEGMMSDPMSMNGYAYAHGNPVNLIDPTGEFAQIFLGATVGAAFGASLGAVQGHTIYTVAATGACGCEGKQITQQSREDFVRDLTIQGALFGGAIGGAIGVGGPVASLMGPVLTAVGLANSARNAWRVLDDWWGDWTIDNVCPLVELAFDLVDALIGRAIDRFSNRNNGNTQVPVRRVGEYSLDVTEVPIENLKPVHPVPRSQVPDGHIENIASNIQSNGYDVSQPAVTVRMPDGDLVIIDGHHRVGAMQLLNEVTMPVRIEDYSTTDQRHLYYILEIGSITGLYNNPYRPTLTNRELQLITRAIDIWKAANGY